jgi:hypothetical protein
VGIYEKSLRMEHGLFASSVGENLCCFNDSLCGSGLSDVAEYRLDVFRARTVHKQGPLVAAAERDGGLL